MYKIGVVIVTYNRLPKLKNALKCYESQQLLPCFILVVDNHSTDSTNEFLRNWEEEESEVRHIAVYLKDNIGGSGGFYTGLQLAMQMQPEWIWVSDDDAYPASDCFSTMSNYINNTWQSNIAALCSKVETDGKVDTWHRRIVKRVFGIVLESKCDVTKYDRPFEITLFSYVGVLINTKKLIEAGLPNSNFFISFDDSEHSYRLSKFGKIFCIPNAVVIHDTNELENCATSWKKYYAIRNKLYSYKMHFGYTQFCIYAFYYFFKNMWDPIRRKLTIAAISDAYSNNLGLHKLYNPNWKSRF